MIDFRLHLVQTMCGVQDHIRADTYVPMDRDALCPPIVKFDWVVLPAAPDTSRDEQMALQLVQQDAIDLDPEPEAYSTRQLRFTRAPPDWVPTFAPVRATPFVPAPSRMGSLGRQQQRARSGSASSAFGPADASLLNFAPRPRGRPPPAAPCVTFARREPPSLQQFCDQSLNGFWGAD